MIQSTSKVSDTLPLMEAFYTIQGEGAHSGKAAYFIRLGGCDVGCHWCDVKDSWSASDFPDIPVSEIVNSAVQDKARIAVITGGEPLMYDLKSLTTELKNEGFQTHIETSGAYPLTGSWDWICFSPKKFKKPLDEVAIQANELKVVIYNKSDFDWAISFLDRTSKKCRKFLQPEWSRSKEMTPLIIDFVKENPEWEISLQTHKYMDIP